MKFNKILPGVFVIVLIAIFMIGTSGTQEPELTNLQMPDHVKSIVENKCFGCHNTDSKNEDAKEKLDFKTLNDLNNFKKVGKLRDIADILEEGKMPPKKFLDMHPEKKLTNEETAALTAWVNTEAGKIIGSN